MLLILASSSASRRALMQRLELPFSTVAAGIDETQLAGESPQQMVARLSRSKAARVAAQHPGALVIGSDQVAVCDGQVTGKPGNHARALELLQRFSGQQLEFLTGVSLLGPGVDDYFVDCTRVQFRNLSDAEILRYLDRDQPWDCAGCFRLESAAPMLFESLHNQDPTALLGLPLVGLCRALRKAGFALP